MSNILDTLKDTFLDIENVSDKQIIISEINQFINRYKDYGPEYGDSAKNNVKDYFINYAKQNRLQILNLNYFIKNIPSKLQGTWSWNGYRNDFCIAQDINGVKKILIRRNNFYVTELSTRLSIKTLRLFYKTFVLDVVDLKAHNRFIKEIETIFNDAFINKFKCSSGLSGLYITKYISFNFDKSTFTLTITTQRCNIDLFNYNNNKKDTFIDNKKYKGITAINQILMNLLNEKDSYFNSNKELSDFINNKYEEIINGYRQNINSIVSKLNTEFS